VNPPDCLLIATDHTDFDYELIVTHGQLGLDTQNATKAVEDGGVVGWG
jgi:UDP-N-acetyl-D-glucosamine dehydrogenase